jgi:hypothetical protein
MYDKTEKRAYLTARDINYTRSNSNVGTNTPRPKESDKRTDADKV